LEVASAILYYNVFLNNSLANAEYYIGGVMTGRLQITNPSAITEAIELTSASELERLMEIPGIAGNQAAYNAVVLAGQIIYAESYKFVYYVRLHLEDWLF
jgi:hypothetical protein